MTNNKISVIMACYNCEKTLNKAIDSILAQTYTNWVMICCDDGSTDRTYQILCEYKAKHPEKFLVIKNDTNKKLAYSLNRCLKYVKTDIVARMDADDESMSQRFEKQLAFLQQHSECVVCGTKILYVNEISGGRRLSDTEEFPNRYTPFRHTPFNHATIMCRKEMYDFLGGYADIPSAVRCEDKELWYRFFDAGLTGKNLNEPLYVVHENKALIYRNTSRSRWNDFLTDLNGYKLLRYPWYWYTKPFLHLIKILVPKWAVVMYYKTFRK